MPLTPDRSHCSPPHRRPDWRTYQQGLRRCEAADRRRKLRIRAELVLVILLALTWIGLRGKSPLPGFFDPSAPLRPTRTAAPSGLDRRQVQSLLAAGSLAELGALPLERTAHGIGYRLETELDPGLQKALDDALNPAHARYIAIVALVPATGRILALAGYNRLAPAHNPCLESRFPAASVFKIVTAAAAIEQCRFTAEAPTFYTGRKYTLYKSQLKEKKTRWSNEVSFRRAFAESVNPVFGKIGLHCLGRDILETYGSAFGFNRRLACESLVPPSRLEVTDEPFQWAEVACGFNRRTTLTPLHGAMIAAALANDGLMMAPLIVDRVRSDSGEMVYRGRPTPLGRVAAPRTCGTIRRMMQAVVDVGTCRKQFRGYRKDPVLGRLSIGGKTGSINNRDQDARFDWFVGFASEKGGDAALAVAAVVAHEKYIGTRAARYARVAMKAFFQRRFAEHEGPEGKTKAS